MEIRYRALLIFLLFAVFGPINSFGLNNIDYLGFQPESATDSTRQESFISKEFRYYAPKSGFVYLAWYVNNVEMDEAIAWNKDTKRNNNLLSTPMLAKGDTFFIRLKVPEGTVLQYNFWITRSKQGHYQDYWDLNSSGTITVTDGTPVIAEANYSVEKEEKSSGVIALGWLILIVLVIGYVVVVFLGKLWIKSPMHFGFVEKVLFTGLSLLLFHAIARADIIGINAGNSLNLSNIPKIMLAGVSDFLFVSGLVGFFVLLLLIVKNERSRKWIFGIFTGLSVLATLSAFTNITIVVFLGKPFTYQWLYYSDFLGSDEAMTALQENLALKTAFNLLALCISMLILARILNLVYRLIMVNKLIKYLAFAFIGLAVVIVAFKATKTRETWTKGQADNAVIAMAYSVVTLNSDFSFFSTEVPENMLPFNPTAGKEMEQPILIPGNHSVKNVLFIVLESAGALYFDAYDGGFNLTPNLNNYESQALRFENAYAHAPATNRSLVSILGSIYPYLSYKSLTQEYPAIQHPTISSVLKGKGYRTSFFSSANLNFQNCRAFLSSRDFDRVEDFSTIDCGEKFQLDSENYKEGNGIDDMCLADCLFSWLDEDTSKNFFSLIWTVQCHYPYFFEGKEEEFGVEGYYQNRYLNALKHNDELIGEVMHMLENRDLASSTLVVVVGDHGEAFGQHGQYGHGTVLYEENVKVPLYFINSTLFHGELKSDIAGMKDLAATSLSIIGVDVPESWQGRNLLTTTSDEAFYYAPWSDYLFGYRKGNLKYIFNETRSKAEIFDLSSDSSEKVNLAGKIPENEISNARNRLAAWVQNQDNFIRQLVGTE